MRASELIERLKDISARCGDLEVRQYGYFGIERIDTVTMENGIFYIQPGQFHDTPADEEV